MQKIKECLFFAQLLHVPFHLFIPRHNPHEHVESPLCFYFSSQFSFLKGKYLEVGGENKNKTAFYFYLHFLKSEVGRMRELKIKVDEA